MSNPTIDCEEALRLLAVYLDGELHGTEHEGVERHLKACRSCYSRAEFERRLKAELGRLGREDVRPAFEQRIRQLITSFASPPAQGQSDQ
ncbi:MAG: anti-sigma factor family protein [Gemmatimonadales bacterium]